MHTGDRWRRRGGREPPINATNVASPNKLSRMTVPRRLAAARKHPWNQAQVWRAIHRNIFAKRYYGADTMSPAPGFTLYHTQMKLEAPEQGNLSNSFASATPGPSVHSLGLNKSCPSLHSATLCHKVQTDPGILTITATRKMTKKTKSTRSLQ